MPGWAGRIEFSGAIRRAMVAIASTHALKTAST